MVINEGINFKHLEEDLLRFSELASQQQERRNQKEVNLNVAHLVCGGKNCNKNLRIEKNKETGIWELKKAGWKAYMEKAIVIKEKEGGQYYIKSLIKFYCPNCQN